MTSQASIRFRLVALALIAVVVGSISWLLRRDAPAWPKVCNILLISIDTCRADHLSCYGYGHRTTPTIDAIAQEGVLFSNVLSPVPLTLPSHSSMLTGTIPPYHGAHLNFDYQLGESAKTLAEILKGHGFTTGAVVSAFVLDSQFGLGQGFDTYHDRFGADLDRTGHEERKADETNRHAMSWLAEHGHVPFFLFLHYFDPHDPYEPPEPFASRFPGNPYAGEIAYTDHCIGQVIGKLKELGLYDSTLIVITADHGEMLGYFIYEAAVKVPLIFKLPGQRHPRRIEELVGLIDIVPTVCGLLGIEPGSDLQGMDLSGCVRDGTRPEQGRDLYCESLTATSYDASSLLGVVTDRWKYIQTTRPELYDLARDPGESKNLVVVEAHRASDMRARLKEMLAKQLREGSDSRLELDEKDRQRLESLGYVGGGSPSGAFAFDASKDDPKDLVDFHKSALKLIRLHSEKRYAEARSLCEQMLQQRPAFVEGYKLGGAIAREMGDHAEANLHFRRALELKPDDASMHNDLGLVLRSQNKPDEAISHFRRALEIRPDLLNAHCNLGNALLAQGKADEAMVHQQRALQIDPDFIEARYNLGNTLLAQDKADEAIASYQQVLQMSPGFTEARYNLGIALGSQGKMTEAIRCYQQVLQATPNDARVHCSLGIAMSEIGHFDEGIDHFRQALRLRPDDVESPYNLALALEAQSQFAEASGHFREAARLKPDWPMPLNDLAWILSTCTDAGVRDASEAVELAERASELTGHKDAAILDTLAAAYAEAGLFDKAVTTAQEAIRLASAAETKELAEAIGKRLELYRHAKPYRELVPGGRQREDP